MPPSYEDKTSVVVGLLVPPSYEDKTSVVVGLLVPPSYEDKTVLFMSLLLHLYDAGDLSSRGDVNDSADKSSLTAQAKHGTISLQIQSWLDALKLSGSFHEERPQDDR